MSLNIDHSRIIEKAEKRSAILKQIEALLTTEVHTTLDRMQRAEAWLRDLYEVYQKLDTEGLEMLPDVVRFFLKQRHHSMVENLISGTNEIHPGLEAVAALIPKREVTQPKPDPRGQAWTQRNPMEPQHDGNGQFYEVNITFKPTWDTQYWPNGAWFAQYPGEVNYGIGATPTEALLHLDGKL